MRNSFSPEEVMRELRVSEDELKRLVVERWLPAWRVGNATQFRREDVSRLRRRWTSYFFGFSL